MLLAIDVGNTNIVIGLHSENNWIKSWRIATVHSKMPDEYSVIVRDLLKEIGIEGNNISNAIISSVVPVLTPKLEEMIKSLTNIEPIIVGPGVKTGLKIKIGNPNELGSDIVSNSVAAHQLVKSNVIVVDFGTALTFTAITENGEIAGVSIAPGLQFAAETLSRNTAQLPQVWLKSPKKAIGTNTIESIQSGVIYGYTGLVEKLVDMMKKELGGIVQVIATGGKSGVIAPLTDRIDRIEPWLILDGLKLIAEKNSNR